MSQERYVFPSSVDGLLKGLGPLATPALKQHLKDTGLDVEHLPPAIPVEKWSPHLVSMALFSWPDQPRDEAIRLLGLNFIRGWKQTLMGSAVASLLRVVGPARTLPRLDRAFRTSDNFTRAETTLLDANTALITINEVQAVPTYWVGILQGGLEVLGREGEVSLERYEPPGATLRVTWR